MEAVLYHPCDLVVHSRRVGHPAYQRVTMVNRGPRPRRPASESYSVCIAAACAALLSGAYAERLHAYRSHAISAVDTALALLSTTDVLHAENGVQPD